MFRALYCDAKTMRHIGKPISPTDARASLRATMAAHKRGALRFFVIAERESRCAVGLCSLRPAAWDEHGAEAGLMLLPAARGHGYARETLRALIEVAFFQLRAKAVWVQYRRANVKMARLCQAAGFESGLKQNPARGCVGLVRRSGYRKNSCKPT
ncbi:MAG: GNAT family N-acetyltransferase [Proteobacteria bacterium]|nr:GNAT family N-acetyltransferase [Pseudomonadota bacterium]